MTRGPNPRGADVGARVLRMLEYQQQISSLEGECRDLKACLQVGGSSPATVVMMMMMMKA